MADEVMATNSVDRRTFLGKAALGAAGVATVGAAACDGPGAGPGGPAVSTQPNIMWRLASSFPRSVDALYGATERLSTKLEAITEGRFRIRPYPAGELVPGLQVLDAAQQGTVQVGHTPGYYYTGKNPALAFDTCVPFGLAPRQQMAWLYDGGGMDLMRELYSDFGVINFVAGNTGTQMGGWFKREVNSVGDLRGIKMRIPGMGGEVMSRLGVTVQVLQAGDIYPALERGAIDATEWVGPYDDEKLGFNRVAPFYYYPGWWEPGPAMSFLVNKQAWDTLPKSYQEAFEVAAHYAAVHTQTIYDANNPAALQRMLAGGTQLRRYSDEIMKAAQTMTTDMLQQAATADRGTYGKVLDAFEKFRTESHRWFGTNEQAYNSFVYAGITDG
jgi:TRAP-type mannitol/chloroaromatic compound transport system substrate-binding protein